ncbi:MAG: tetratricopeptide repeat protein [Deltaproteobacteria bacterium]|nr:tetratricopeptide repeat protein [Deltaproteobacteria bacterium]
MIDDPIATERNRADDLMKSGRFAEAAEIYRRLALERPDEDSHLLALAWALHDSGEPQEAAACFERLFRKELGSRLFTGFAYDELVRIYRAEKNWKALISVCERAAQAQPGEIGLMQTLGEAYLSAGRGADAAQLFERLTRIEPDAPEHWCSLGEAWLAAGDPDRAEATYGKAAAIDPAARGRFVSRLAEGLLRAGHPGRAKAAWEESLGMAAADSLCLTICWMGIGDCEVRLGKPDAAEAAYGRAADLDRASAGSCWCRLGNRLAAEGLHAHAAEAFARAVSSEPENPLYPLRLATAYAAQGQNDLAAETLRRAEARRNSPAKTPVREA